MVDSIRGDIGNLPIQAAEQSTLLSLEKSHAMLKATTSTGQEEEKEQRKSFKMYGQNRSGTVTWARAQTPLVWKLRLSFQSSIVRIAHSARVDTP